MNAVDAAIREITKQQEKFPQFSTVWTCGEQLKDICRDQKCAELFLLDQSTGKMGIADAEKQIKAWADGHRSGNGAAVGMAQADAILREFYGFPEGPLSQAAPPEGETGPAKRAGLFDLDLEGL